MKLFFKFIAIVVVIAIFLAKYSETETTYKCVGEIDRDGGSTATTIYIRYTEFKWWVALWSKSGGSMIVESPNNIFTYYDNVTRGDMQNLIFAGGKQKGLFSPISKAITVSIQSEYFQGICETSD